MARNVEEWIANETKEDTLKLGMSLKAENYKLPMIKLTFGDQILSIPQVESTYVMAKYGYAKLKDNIVDCNNDELKKVGVNIFDASV